jgi:hypothetical protein
VINPDRFGRIDPCVLGIAHSLGVDRAELQQPIHRAGAERPEQETQRRNGQRDPEGMGPLVTGATSSVGKAVAEELGR